MSANRWIGRAVAAVVLALATMDRAACDPADANVALVAAEAALQKKDWETARTQFGRALRENPMLLEARLGLAEAEFGGGHRGQALLEFRTVLATVEEALQPTEEHVALYARARKRLGQVSKDDLVLDALARKQADALGSLASKWATKDPVLAADAARAALRLAPDHARGEDLRLVEQGAGTGGRIGLFNGRDGSGFEPMGSHWRVEDGLLIGDVKESAFRLPTLQTWRGNFDVLIEARFVQQFPGAAPPMFGLVACYGDGGRAWQLSCLRSDVVWRQNWGEGLEASKDHASLPLSKVDPRLTSGAWITYQLRFRSRTIQAFVGGKSLGIVPRPKDLAESPIALVAQFCKVAFRRVEVTQR